ncbi:hypothetical protein TNCV_304791 [Trichonephila clavipes]|nr:hypothetical protein TNCV_304791 [Trichonephila clavipes]
MAKEITKVTNKSEEDSDSSVYSDLEEGNDSDSEVSENEIDEEDIQSEKDKLENKEAKKLDNNGDECQENKILRKIDEYEYDTSDEEWLDSPGWALAFSRSLFQASFLLASVFQFLVLKTRSFSRPSIHLRFGLPFLRVPIG